MELGRESKRIKKIRDDAKKKSIEEQIKIRAEKAEADKKQRTLKWNLKGGKSYDGKTNNIS